VLWGFKRPTLRVTDMSVSSTVSVVPLQFSELANPSLRQSSSANEGSSMMMDNSIADKQYYDLPFEALHAKDFFLWRRRRAAESET